MAPAPAAGPGQSSLAHGCVNVLTQNSKVNSLESLSKDTNNDFRWVGMCVHFRVSQVKEVRFHEIYAKLISKILRCFQISLIAEPFSFWKALV